jgi:hypothetical protein
VSTEDIYLAGIIALAVWSLIALAGALWLAGQRDLARRRYATMLTLHSRQRVRIADLRGQVERYRGELDAYVEATRPAPVPEDLETEVRRTLDALPVVDEPEQPAPAPVEKAERIFDVTRLWAPFKTVPPRNGCAIYPHRQES